MGFRQDKQQRRDWNRWVAEHREELLLTGVPEDVFSDEFRWMRMLEEGGDDYPSGWSVEMISDAEAAKLYRFIRDHDLNTDFRGLRCRLDARPGPIQQ